MASEELTRPSGVSIDRKCVVEALNFFDQPFTDRAVESVYNQVHSPVSAVTPTSSSAEFVIPGTSDYMIASDTVVDLKLQIFDAKGNKLAKPTKDDPNIVG